MLKIREIKPEEHKFLREMLYEAIYIPFGAEKSPKTILNTPQFLKYFDKFIRKGDLAYVLVDKSELVGAVWTRLYSPNNPGFGFIDEQTPEFSIAVRDKYRNKGFGTLLIQKLFVKLKTEGFKSLSLSVDKQNPAVNLYLRLGFEVVSVEGTAFTMLKKL